MNCTDLLLKNIIAAECDNSTAMGVYGDIILINKASIDTTTTTLENKVITSLVLNTGTKAVKLITHDSGVDTEVTLSKGTYVSNWIHKFTTRVFLKNQDIKDAIDLMKNGSFIAVIENKDNGKGGDTKYEAYGFEAGLRLQEVTSTSIDADSIVYTLVFSSEDTSKEPHLPYSIFKTDIATTKAMIDALTA